MIWLVYESGSIPKDSIVNIAIFEFNIAVPAQNGQNEFMFALAAPIKIS